MNRIKEVMNKKCVQFYFNTSVGSIKFESKLMQGFNLGLRLKLNNRDLINKDKIRSILKIENSTEIDYNNKSLIINDILEVDEHFYT